MDEHGPSRTQRVVRMTAGRWAVTRPSSGVLTAVAGRKDQSLLDKSNAL